MITGINWPLKLQPFSEFNSNIKENEHGNQQNDILLLPMMIQCL